MQKKFDTLRPEECEWLQDRLVDATDHVSEFAPEHIADPLLLAALDAAFTGYLAEAGEDWTRDNDVLQAIGVGFGNQLVK